MPRICPLQLITCLSVLLSPDGGILSEGEVTRLVSLMIKFSKKLVSKCVYILILKSTKTELVDLFMQKGGWSLIHTWLQDAITISNWDLVTEILGLLLTTPIDVERLKQNNIPKLVKSLTKLKDVESVQDLSSQLVSNWLALVKSNTKVEDVHKVEVAEPVVEVEPVAKTELPNENDCDETNANVNNDTVDASQMKTEKSEEISPSNFYPVYSVTVRDGKHVIRKNSSAGQASDDVKENKKEVEQQKEKSEKEREKEKIKATSGDKKAKSHSSSLTKHSSSSSRTKSSSSSNSKHKHSSSSSSNSSSSKSSSSRDKEKDKNRERDKSKDRHKENGSKHGSSKDKDTKEKQAEKDKDTLAKLKPQSIERIGRIPKKTDEKVKDTKEVRKPTMSVEVRKSNEDRPKSTVKVFNSKRRSTGLEEEAKPPPPRPVKKTPTTTVLPAVPPIKRPSPIRDVPVTPPEKKLKVDIPERPGAIKLIPPKPKPSILQESDLFMDALAASATTKKEPKKRKRRTSVSKDTPESPTAQEPPTSTSPVTSPLGLKNIAPINFYQDTLETEQATEEKDEKSTEIEAKDEPMETETPVISRVNESGLKGVLVVSKRKGSKKSVRFNDNDLTQIRFFELDETERVNVTKTFMDMAKMEMSSEREAVLMSRKLPTEDMMSEQMAWRLLFLIDQNDPLAVPGSKSLEKDIQFAREKSVLQTFYFDKRKIPDSPEEPIPENHQIIDPIVIPLDDAETQELDLRNTPWPEPKGSPPPPVQETNIPPQMFPTMPMPFQNFPHGGPPQVPFQGMPPRFGQPQPGMFPGPPNMMPNGNMMGPPGMGPPEMMPPHLNPNAFGHGPGPGPGPDNFNPMMNDNPNFPMPFSGPNMFPPNNFNMNRGGGGGGNRGGFRRGGGGGGGNNGTWMRMPSPGNWHNRGGGGGGRGGGRICKNIKNHGYCRNMDKCHFIHPK